MAAFDYLKFKIKLAISGEARLNRTGLDAQAGPLSIKAPEILMSTDVAPATAGGADQMLGAIFSIAGAGNTEIDLTSFTDFLLRATQAFARIKAYYFHLLSAADAPDIGTACSGVVIGNASANQHLLNLGAAAHTFALLNGEYQLWGTRSAAGKTVDGTRKLVKILNSDASITAKVLVAICGGTA